MSEWKIQKKIASITTCCFVLLLGGILATFVIPAGVLFAISIGCFAIGTTGLEFSPDETGIYWFCSGCIAISFGLFKFIFIVILLDQKDCWDIKLKIRLWFIVEIFCYIVVYLLLPQKLPRISGHITILVTIILVFGLLIYGKIYKIYRIDSNRLDIMMIIRAIKRKTGLFESKDYASKNAIIAISKATIILFLLIPYGICDSQEQYVYEYQSKGLRKPNITIYSMKPNFWPLTVFTLTIISFSLLIIGCRYSKWRLNYLFSCSLKNQIILGNNLIIISTLLCGFLESYRLETIWWKNHTAWNLLPDIRTQKTDNTTTPVADISVFMMIPQIMLLGISEVLVIPTCIELIYTQSAAKYLSIAFIVCAVEIGGISDLISMIMDYFNLFETRLNSSKQYFDFKLDYLLYILSLVALMSVLLNIFLVKKFAKYFKK